MLYAHTQEEMKPSSKIHKGPKMPWMSAVKKARKDLKISGFVAVKKGTPLYVKAKKYHNG